jgi:Neutral/alkaline non-lysosomal ceramidase, N-terminal
VRFTRAFPRSLCFLLIACFLSTSAPAEGFRAGAAKRDITPANPIYLSGYASRNKPSEGVDQPIFVRALALEDSQGTKGILVTLELVGITKDFTESVADRVKRELGVDREHFMIVASHTHNGPAVYGNLTALLGVSETDEAVIKRHTEKMAAEVFNAACEAVNRLEPARLTFGHGRAAFATNRRVFTARGVEFGANFEGPVDHDVPVLRIESPEGDLRAVVFGYACHGTTLRGDYYLLGGDWPGYAQKYLELAYPGATALFVTGCAGDADPQPRGKIAQTREHGLEMAGAVASVFSHSMNAIGGPWRAAFERVTLEQGTPPSQEEFQRRLQDSDPFVQKHARRNLDKLARGQELTRSYASPVQVWRFGDDLTLVALGGEVVVDYALRLKRELGREKLWVAAYANDVFAYIPSNRILIEGGYEADFSMLYYDFPTRWATSIEDTLIKAVHDLVARTRQ